MTSIERQLQLCLHKIQNWANVFKKQNACVHFRTKRKPHNDPCLHFHGNQIKVVKEVTFLGVIFHNKLSFVPHIKMFKGSRCHKSRRKLQMGCR